MLLGRKTFSIRKKFLEKIWEKKVTIALNVLYTKKEKIYPAYVLKHNSNREKQVILLMILNGGKREANSEGRLPYLEVKKTISII